VCVGFICASLSVTGCSKTSGFCGVIGRERAGFDAAALPREHIASLEALARQLAPADRTAVRQIGDVLRVGEHPASYSDKQKLEIARGYIAATLYLDGRLKSECGKDLGRIPPGFLGIRRPPPAAARNAP
jgi:hypothetical protein